MNFNLDESGFIFPVSSLLCWSFSNVRKLKIYAAYINFFFKVSLNSFTNRNASCCAYQKFSPGLTTDSHVGHVVVGGESMNHFNLLRKLQKAYRAFFQAHEFNSNIILMCYLKI